MTTDGRVAGSFRDPSGFMFFLDGEPYRQINDSYREHYEHLTSSGLFDVLFDRELLVRHQEVDAATAPVPSTAFRVLKPTPVPFVSYPYEWCFGQLKAAALLTLEIARTALEHDVVLKDASAYNVQFFGARPVFIDTLSFAPYREGEPWVAYRQFCQHFLAPLVLMRYVDVRLVKLFLSNIDGVPLDLASALLPRRAKLRPAIATHIVLHARTQRRYSDAGGKARTARVSRLGLRGLLDNLESTVRRLEWQLPKTEWGDYYQHTNYADDAMADKHRLVREFVAAAGGRRVIDMGANTGEFSVAAAEHASYVVSMDVDPVAVESNFQRRSAERRDDVLPLWIDLAVPSPGIGWTNSERGSLHSRASDGNTVVALALIHHLAISNNVPLDRVADFFADYAESLIVEFVPKADSQVKRLLSTREDVFPRYTSDGFETDFSARFEIVRREPIQGSERTLYLMQRRS